VGRVHTSLHERKLTLHFVTGVMQMTYSAFDQAFRFTYIRTQEAPARCDVKLHVSDCAVSRAVGLQICLYMHTHNIDIDSRSIFNIFHTFIYPSWKWVWIANQSPTP
jgi:hypothetical protein